MTAAALGRAAVNLAQAGIPVFPLQPRGKRPYAQSHGVLEASTDVDQVARWWSRRPRSNIGVATGRVYIVDIDCAAAEKVWAGLTAQHGRVATRVVVTSRGWHLWYLDDEDGTLPSTAGRLGRGIDTRGHHGYAIAPPSIHRTGHEYRWAGANRIAPLPAWLRLLVTPPPPRPRVLRPPLASGEATSEGERRLAGICRRLADAQPGTRHPLMYWSARQAGALVDAGLIARDVAEGELHRATQAWGLADVPYERRWVARTVADGMAKGGGL